MISVHPANALEAIDKRCRVCAKPGDRLIDSIHASGKRLVLGNFAEPLEVAMDAAEPGSGDYDRKICCAEQQAENQKAWHR